MKFLPRSCRRSAGFTLLEIMLVVAIIMLLLGTGVYFITGYFQQGQETATLAQVQKIDTSLKTYYLNNGFYPSTAQGLNALVSQPTGNPQPRKWSQLMEGIKKDPWGNDYVYLVPGKRNPKSFDLYSKGPDGVDGNADDIGNFDAQPSK